MSAVKASRRTRQGAVIEAVLGREPRALSVVEIQAAAGRELPGLGRATVYRHLKRLVDTGAAEVVALPGEPPRYERAGRRHHHHFRCRRCDRVYELPGCPAGLQRLVPAGFVLESHQVVLDGRCARCA